MSSRELIYGDCFLYVSLQFQALTCNSYMDGELENNFAVVCLFILFSFFATRRAKTLCLFFDFVLSLFFGGGGGGRGVFQKFKRQKIIIKGNTIYKVLGVKWLF